MVDEFTRHADEFGDGSGASEANFVVGSTPIRRADQTLVAVPAGDDALDHHEAIVVEVIKDSSDPLVAQYQWVAHVREVNRTVNEFEVRAAHAAGEGLYEKFVGLRLGTGDVLKTNVSGRRDDQRTH
jgi:hypothetical protein